MSSAIIALFHGLSAQCEETGDVDRDTSPTASRGDDLWRSGRVSVDVLARVGCEEAAGRPRSLTLQAGISRRNPDENRSASLRGRPGPRWSDHSRNGIRPSTAGRKSGRCDSGNRRGRAGPGSRQGRHAQPGRHGDRRDDALGQMRGAPASIKPGGCWSRRSRLPGGFPGAALRRRSDGEIFMRSKLLPCPALSALRACPRESSGARSSQPSLLRPGTAG